MSTYCGLPLFYYSVLNVKTVVGAFNQEEALVVAFSMIAKTDCCRWIVCSTRCECGEGGRRHCGLVHCYVATRSPNDQTGNQGNTRKLWHVRFFRQIAFYEEIQTKNWKRCPQFVVKIYLKTASQKSSIKILNLSLQYLSEMT